MKFGPYANFCEAKEDFKRMMSKDNFRSKEAEIIAKRMYWAFADGYMIEQFPDLPDGEWPTCWGVRLDPTPGKKHGGVVILYWPGVGDEEKDIIEISKYHK